MLSPFFCTTSRMRLAMDPTRLCGATYPFTDFKHFFWKSAKLSSSCSSARSCFSAFGQTFSWGFKSGLYHVFHNYPKECCLAVLAGFAGWLAGWLAGAHLEQEEEWATLFQVLSSSWLAVLPVLAGWLAKQHNEQEEEFFVLLLGCVTW